MLMRLRIKAINNLSSVINKVKATAFVGLIGMIAPITASAVPADTYSNLSITFTATDNTVCTMKGNVTLNHNTVGRLVLTGKKFKATTGEAEVNATAGITGNKVKWVQLWENGPKFAEFNIGATSATDCGGYYTWGGTYKNGTGIIWNDDHNTGNTGTENLTGTDDTATNLWGSKWRMPTSDELEALLSECTCTWTTQNEVYGLLCTGKGAYSSNSVFLPAAGSCSDGSVGDQGDGGYYWSSTSGGSDDACFLYFDSGSQIVGNYFRDFGFSVRAVLAE